MTEKWKVLESLLIGMDCLRRYQYKYLGMNYSRHPATKRVRFEYVFRNPRTVWLGFTYYPANQKQTDYLDLDIHSPFMREALRFPEWIGRYNHCIDLCHFDQFGGDYHHQAQALVAKIDSALLSGGLDEVLGGDSGITLPTLNMKL